jgi:hypothetical protein
LSNRFAFFSWFCLSDLRTLLFSDCCFVTTLPWLCHLVPNGDRMTQRSLLPTEIIIRLKQQQLQLSEECALFLHLIRSTMR